MDRSVPLHRPRLADAVFGVLDPLPFGFFTAALVFDILYMRTAGVLWNKGAAWLIVFGLLLAVIPRLVNLVQVWVTSRQWSGRADRIDFWLNLLAIVAAILNAFVHSRDAYTSVVPLGLTLSVLTVLVLLVTGWNGWTMVYRHGVGVRGEGR